MLNIIWLGLIVLSVVIGIITGKTADVVDAFLKQTKFAVELSLGLLGLLAFWLGIMKIAEESGLVQKLAKAITPVLKKLFKDVPEDHPAFGAMVMNMGANMLGLANAATPFGLKAMEELQKLNPYPKVASNAMVTFLAINTSSIQLIPATAIAMLAAGGGRNPTIIVLTSFLATLASTAAALILVKIFERLPLFQIKKDLTDIPMDVNIAGEG